MWGQPHGARGWGVRAPGRRPEAGAVLGGPGRAPCASAASCPVQPLFPTPCGTAAVGGTGVSPALAVAGLGGALKDAGRRACPEVCAGVTAQMCDLTSWAGSMLPCCPESGWPPPLWPTVWLVAHRLPHDAVHLPQAASPPWPEPAVRSPGARHSAPGRSLLSKNCSPGPWSRSTECDWGWRGQS